MKFLEGYLPERLNTSNLSKYKGRLGVWYRKDRSSYRWGRCLEYEGELLIIDDFEFYNVDELTITAENTIDGFGWFLDPLELIK